MAAPSPAVPEGAAAGGSGKKQGDSRRLGREAAGKVSGALDPFPPHTAGLTSGAHLGLARWEDKRDENLSQLQATALGDGEATNAHFRFRPAAVRGGLPNSRIWRTRPEDVGMGSGRRAWSLRAKAVTPLFIALEKIRGTSQVTCLGLKVK